MPPAPEHHRLVGKLVVETELGTFLGDTRIRLLEAIDQHGSISHAARTIPLSYKAAWDAVDAMNNLADQPLVERLVGGQRGGGTRLTDYGRRMVAFYRAMEENYQQILDRSAQHVGDRGQGDLQQFRGLIRRMAMHTSARNQFAGPVTALREGAVNFEVCLRIDAHNELTAIITRASAERLGLAIGKEAYAFIKASSVILTTDPEIRTSARNRLWGTVSRVHEGAVNDEVTLTLEGGRTVVAIVTHDSVQRMGLAEGVPAGALVKASSIILATFA
jgi:molybdate transport system regulatory protein